MAFTPFTKPLDHIRSLPDQPRLSEGYTPEVLKERFDRAGVELADYLNQTLLSELADATNGKSGAESIGSAAVEDIPGGTLHAQLCALNDKCSDLSQSLKDAATGVFPPESISLSLLDAAAQSRVNEAYGRTLRVHAFTTAGEHTFTAPRSGIYRVRLCGAGAAGSYYAPQLTESATLCAGDSFFGRGGASGAAIEAYLQLNAGEVCTLTVGAGGKVLPLPQNMSSQEDGYEIYDILTYMTDGSWISPGEESRFSHNEQGLLFTAEGGGSSQAARAICHSEEAVAAFLTSGEVYRPLYTVSGALEAQSEEGLASALGQGGALRSDTQESLTPGYGGGGHGGLLYLDAPVFVIESAAQSGADGAIFIEFIR